MIERDIVTRKIKEYQIQDYISKNLRGAGLSEIRIQRTPLGEKITVTASRPGLVIGGGGSNIKKLTRNLKKKFELDNPQIEINELENQSLVAQVVAERIALALEKYGLTRFKGIGHRALEDIMQAGAMGTEIIISGKIPSSRARTWRFYQGYIKKCGNVAMEQVDSAYETAHLKSGVVGIKVSIMPPGTKLPDDISIHKEQEATGEEIKTDDTTEEIITEAAEKTVKEDEEQTKE